MARRPGLVPLCLLVGSVLWTVRGGEVPGRMDPPSEVSESGEVAKTLGASSSDVEENAAGRSEAVMGCAPADGGDALGPAGQPQHAGVGTRAQGADATGQPCAGPADRG
jgi:hypothetical protein